MNTSTTHRRYPSVIRRLTVQNVARTLTAGVRAFFAGCSFEVIEDGYLCEHCHDFVAASHRCPHAMEGICVTCGSFWTPLTRYGKCREGEGHEILKRRFKYPEERWGGVA